MISYTIYNKTTGLIRKSFFAATSDSLGNYYNSETEAVIEGGDLDPKVFKIVDGEPVEISAPNIGEEDSRMMRDKRLEISDWTQMVDSPLTDSKKTEWATYRQALRDLPTHSNWPELADSDWPTMPS
tara:strand:+ start:842 stop:1222 length:381 start_codon:yes stop_codon:yes gene_type:complete